MTDLGVRYQGLTGVQPAGTGLAKRAKSAEVAREKVDFLAALEEQNSFAAASAPPPGQDPKSALDKILMTAAQSLGPLDLNRGNSPAFNRARLQAALNLQQPHEQPKAQFLSLFVS